MLQQLVLGKLVRVRVRVTVRVLTLTLTLTLTERLYDNNGSARLRNCWAVRLVGLVRVRLGLAY